jgi:membrane-associated phospholipid phosphatase
MPRYIHVNFPFLILFLIVSHVQAADLSQGSNTSFLNADSLADSMRLEMDSLPAVIDDEEADRSSSRLSDFPKDLAENFTGLFSASNLPLLYAGIAVSSVGMSFDNDVKGFFAGQDRMGRYNEVGNFIGSRYVLGGSIAGLFLVSRFTDNVRFRNMAYSMAQAHLINTALTVGIKHTVGRTRPDGSDDLSFLSGHTAGTFTTATIISHYYGRKIGTIAYLSAAFVAGSRIGSNVHYLSDVLAGATLGYVVGKTVVRNQPGAEPPRFQWFPSIQPSRKSFGLNLVIRF